MKKSNIPSSLRDGAGREASRRELHQALKGLVSSAVLTAIAFALVIVRPFSVAGLGVAIAALALLQIACQFFFFLHIDLRRSHRDDLQLVLFTGLVIVLMVAGSMWILSNQHARMG